MIMHVPRNRTSSRRSGVGTILWAWTTSLTPQPPHWNKRARCPSPRRPLRGGRGPRNPGPGVVRTGRPLNAPRPLGYGGGRRWLVGAGQPAGRFPSRGAQARAPLLATRRAQPRTEPVTGSLAWILWLPAARKAGARPSIAKASLLGVVAVPLSMAAALGALALTGLR